MLKVVLLLLLMALEAVAVVDQDQTIMLGL
jgi:hypothetical protein